MYNGIGLPTARGSGTNGYVQRNWAAVRKTKEKVTYKTEEELEKFDAANSRQPNQEILDHERKRKVEVKCIEFEEILEEQGYSQLEIDNKVASYRNMLMGNDGKLDQPPRDEFGRIMVRETHQLAEAQQEKNAKLREAFGISEYFVEGSSLDPQRHAKEAAARAAAAAEQKKQPSAQARYTLVRTPSPSPTDTRQFSPHKKRKRKTTERSSSPETKKRRKRKSKKYKRERSLSVKHNVKKKRSSSKKKKHKKHARASSSSSVTSSCDDSESTSEVSTERDKKKQNRKKELNKVNNKTDKKYCHQIGSKKHYSDLDSSDNSSVYSTKSSKSKDYGTLKKKSNFNKKQSSKKKGRRSRSYEDKNKSKHKKDDIKSTKSKRLLSSGQIPKESSYKKHKSRRSKSVSLLDDRQSSVGRHSSSRSSSKNCYTSDKKHKYTSDRKRTSRSRSSSLKKHNQLVLSHSRLDQQHAGSKKEMESPGQKKRNSSKVYSLQDDKEDARKTKKIRSCSSSSASKNEKSVSPADRVFRKRNRSSSQQTFTNKEGTKTHGKSPSPKRICRSENEHDNSDKKNSRNISLSPKRPRVNSSNKANKIDSSLEKKDNSHCKNKQSKSPASKFEPLSTHKKLKSSGNNGSDTSSLSYSPVDRNPERYQDILPKPVVQLHISGSEDEIVELREREEDQDDQEKEMKTLRILQSGLAAKAKESIEKKRPKQSILDQKENTNNPQSKSPEVVSVKESKVVEECIVPNPSYLKGDKKFSPIMERFFASVTPPLVTRHIPVNGKSPTAASPCYSHRSCDSDSAVDKAAMSPLDHRALASPDVRQRRHCKSRESSASSDSSDVRHKHSSTHSTSDGSSSSRSTSRDSHKSSSSSQSRTNSSSSNDDGRKSKSQLSKSRSTTPRSNSRTPKKSASRSRSPKEHRSISSRSHSRSRSHSNSHSQSSHSHSNSSRRSSVFSRSRSPSIPRSRGSPSFLDRRRITRRNESTRSRSSSSEE